MSLAYLLDPTNQYQNRAGVNNVAGWFEVYRAFTDDRARVYRDFDGTLAQARIGIDNNGRCVMVAEEGIPYRVEMYLPNGELMFTQEPVFANIGGGSGGGGGGDLEPFSALRCDADILRGNGLFNMGELSRAGNGAVVGDGRVVLKKGWWHFDATARISWYGEQNGVTAVQLYTTLMSDVQDFDISYGHDSTVHISGLVVIADDTAQFPIGIDGMQPGMEAWLIDFGVFSINGGAGASYHSGYGIDIDSNNAINVDTDVIATTSALTSGLTTKQDTLTAGDGISIDEDNVISVDESGISGIYTVDYTGGQPVEGTALFDEAYAAYQAGKTLVLNWVNANRKGSCIGYYSAYGLMFAVETVNLNGTQSDAATSGLIQYIWLYRDGTKSRWGNSRLGLLPRSYAADVGKVLMVDPEHPTSHPIWQAIPAQQQADWNEADSAAVDYIKNKPANLVQDANYVHTDNNFTNADATKLSGIAAGAEVNVQANWNETDTTADSYIQNKPTIPAAQVNSDWNAVSGVAEILNKPSIPVIGTITL